MNAADLLEVKNLKMYFPITEGFLRRKVGDVRAVDDVSFTVKRGEVLGMVGESGCGKTTVSRTILRLYDATGGEVWFTRRSGERVELTALDRESMKALRREIRMVFQDPFSSLNPRFPVKDIISEPLVIQKLARGSELDARVAETMRRVGLDPAYMSRYPHEFSGGQRQRIGLARTLVVNPDFVVADEPVSALDVSIQAQVLNLIDGLRQEMGLTMLFIAHDLSVVEHISDRIAVMYVGKLMEIGTTEEILKAPLHPYTEALISAVPPADPDVKPQRIILEGDVPSPANPPSGCVFHPRCRYAQDICRKEAPQLLSVGGDHRSACHFAGKLNLKGTESNDR